MKASAKIAIPILVAVCIAAIVVPGTSGRQREWDNLAALRIDSSYKKIWAEKKITPAPASEDEEFVRRVYLDLTGRIPTARQARNFLESTESQKRKDLIQRLLRSDEFAEYYASQFTSLFLGYRKDRFVDRQEFEKWIQEQLAENKGWDDIARSLITAEGGLADHPELNWYARHKLDAANLADDTARYFLGVQVGCARCHNHPHDQWKLEDFYGLAAFYSGLKRDQASMVEKMKFRKLKKRRQELIEKYKTEDKETMKKPEELKEMRQDLREMLRLTQESSGTIAAEIQGENKVYPAKFLVAPQPAHSTSGKREELANWITAPQNSFFARAFVNRIWGMMMGKGFVEPVDDMSTLNEPSNPELLSWLAADFRSHGFDIKYLLFNIAQSSTYQLSSKQTENENPKYYERAKVKMLNADQMLNSFLQATSIQQTLRLMSRGEYEQRLDFIHRYHVFLFDNDDNQGSKMEFEGTIPQALFLLNGKMTNEAIRPHYANTTTKVFSNFKRPEDRVEAIFLSTLSRKPTLPEKEKILAYVKAGPNEDSVYEDIFWALLNSNEFLFNH